MPVFKDQIQRTVFIKSPPKRIVSLVPSQTELLADLGLDKEVVGITKFCIHPDDWFHSKKRVGGTKGINMKSILSLEPDLIIANKEENVKEQIEELEKTIPVWISDINKLEDALDMISKIGMITNKIKKAEKINNQIKAAFKRLKVSSTPISTCYLIWQNPYMTIGGDTFINNMMKKAGFVNCFDNTKRYPAITIEEIQKKDPELILLSSEPYPFKQSHVDKLQSHFPSAKIILVNGEMFSWYGSRLINAPAYFNYIHQIIH